MCRFASKTVTFLYECLKQIIRFFRIYLLYNISIITALPKYVLSQIRVFIGWFIFYDSANIITGTDIFFSFDRISITAGDAAIFR